MVHVPVGSRTLRGTLAMNERAARSMVRPTAVRAPLTGSTTHAPRPETTSAFSMPAELTPALAGHADVPVDALWSVSIVHSAMGTFGSASVVQSTRQ